MLESPPPAGVLAVAAKPRRCALASKCLTDDGCHRVPPRGVRSCMAASWAAICWSARSGAAALMPAISRTSRPSLGCGRARPSRLASTMPSSTSRRTVRRNRSTVRRTAPPLPNPGSRTRTISPQGWSGRMRRTVGSQESSCRKMPSRCAPSRRFRTWRIASGSRVRRPGLPPLRPRALAARRPALVRSAISARSSCATAVALMLNHRLAQ